MSNLNKIGIATLAILTSVSAVSQSEGEISDDLTKEDSIQKLNEEFAKFIVTRSDFYRSDVFTWENGIYQGEIKEWNELKVNLPH